MGIKPEREPERGTGDPHFQNCDFAAFTVSHESSNPAGITDCVDGKPLQSAGLDGITQDELRTSVERGEAQIARVIAVLLDRTDEFELYFRLAGRVGYLPLLKRRREGVRTWNDFRNLQKFVVRTGGYRGPIFVYPENWPSLSKLGIPSHLSS